jgi:hypothetical protein
MRIHMTPRLDRLVQRLVGPRGPWVGDLPYLHGALYVAAIYWKLRLLRPTPRRVNFCIVGAQKAGTSALASHLKRQPGVLFSSRKEVHFFNRWNRTDEAWYHLHFDWSRRARLVGEATPGYLASGAAVARMAAYNPDMQVIAVLRHPVDRAHSAWNMMRGKGRTSLDFEAWMASDRSGLAAGLYADQIRIWRTHFPNALFLKYEEFRDTPSSVLSEVHEFLGLPTLIPAAIPRKNVFAYDREHTYDRAAMISRFAADIREVERLLGWDCSDWLV